MSTCYSPVRHSTRTPKDAFAFDLHVLSTPPAFVLSQDQTLQFETVASPESLNLPPGHAIYLTVTKPSLTSRRSRASTFNAKAALPILLSKIPKRHNIPTGTPVREGQTCAASSQRDQYIYPLPQPHVNTSIGQLRGKTACGAEFPPHAAGIGKGCGKMKDRAGASALIR